MAARQLETCFSPALYEASLHVGSIVVVIDIFRATSAICTAFENGVKSIIPVAGVEEAREYKERGYLVAAERDGFVLDFADFGNSPFNFTREAIEGKTIVYSTTNGTGIIKKASSAYAIIIASYLNITAVNGWLAGQDRDVVLFCAGWKNRFNLEDTICAGALAERLMNSGLYTTNCDSTHAALDLWSLAKDDLHGYTQKVAQRSRLREKGLDDCISFCLRHDFTKKIPVIKDGILVDII
ncbi:MAG TPA: 2-phosphosulfolactate phosphatase [Bacteroidales bacterium]|nr:2-phosphosulfolactate phosphatase [Bacteroidales bacterium]HPF02857.1 2-phosphosulfolactate phosphatase [Bacteroidales bacterium]HPJ58418.1 2-phosphosulfolactate phosphatase [Bacteroidales bacterium]HPR10776.1 2-phosphosulfolactate phosphatase [Bacteroidales bacterium]HRW86067.1 2-phosphosulfolactate phosphatase [Bacteroidales bacterium]